MEKLKDSNAPQRVLKSLEPPEEIIMNISQKVSGSSLANLLKGIEEFRKCFSEDDQYIVQIKLEKVISPSEKVTLQNGDGRTEELD